MGRRISRRSAENAQKQPPERTKIAAAPRVPDGQGHSAGKKLLAWGRGLASAAPLRTVGQAAARSSARFLPAGQRLQGGGGMLMQRQGRSCPICGWNQGFTGLRQRLGVQRADEAGSVGPELPVVVLACPEGLVAAPEVAGQNVLHIDPGLTDIPLPPFAGVPHCTSASARFRFQIVPKLLPLDND